MTKEDLDLEIINMTNQVAQAAVQLEQMKGALEAFNYLKAKMEAVVEKTQERVDEEV